MLVCLALFNCSDFGGGVVESVDLFYRTEALWHPLVHLEGNDLPSQYLVNWTKEGGDVDFAISSVDDSGNCQVGLSPHITLTIDDTPPLFLSTDLPAISRPVEVTFTIEISEPISTLPELTMDDDVTDAVVSFIPSEEEDPPLSSCMLEVTLDLSEVQRRSCEDRYDWPSRVAQTGAPHPHGA